MAKPLSFKDMINVEPRPGEDELINYRVQKRKRTYSGNEDVKPVDEKSPPKPKKPKLSDQMRKVKAALAFRKNKAKIARGRKIALNRTASQDKLKRRAKVSKRNEFFKKFSKGRPRSEVPFADRRRIEKKLNSPAIKARIEREAKKEVKVKRKEDMERKRNKSANK